ncbi:hypothetical protein [Streptomyces sp. NPDC008150]|uniref:hypothetical protein n=1 Tax=Streptomyces sp. NPDC008150 TaxID=3364816 RepID=UPI0036E9742C
MATLLLGGGAASPARPAPGARVTANGVTVVVTLLPAADGGRELRATFSPRRAGFHVYSIDLPDGGIDGLGIPTRLSVRGGLTAEGRPTADRTVVGLRPAGLPTELPVYPDGPVTFTLPVRPTGSDEADVVVSYGACGASRCLMPVTDEVIRLRLG